MQATLKERYSMTFSTKAKTECASVPVKSPCCRKALLFGLLLRAQPAGEEGDGSRDADRLTVAYSVIPHAAYDPAAMADALIRQVLGREAVLTDETRGGHRYVRLTFSSHQTAAVLRRLSALSEGEGASQIPAVSPIRDLLGMRCSDCAAHFLRGAFLSSGTVSDPDKSVHMEFRIPDQGRAACLLSFWEAAGLTPGLSRSASVGGEYRLCFKSSQSLQDALTYLGAVQTVFDLINIQLIHETRGNESRATNWEAANIRRSVGAGERHMNAIRYLEGHELLRSLPAELQETARLRMLHPEMSLSELAAIHDPPITKSGLNHRLERLVAAWERANSPADS
jgi:hypothetical protein